MASLKSRQNKRLWAKAKASAPNAISGLLDPRDGPTRQYLQHHDVVSRSGVVGGKRHRPRLEQLLDTDFITAEQSEAGRRFAIDYDRGMIDKLGSPLASNSRGGGDKHPPEPVLDAATNYRLAQTALDANGDHRITGKTKPSDVLLMHVHADMPDLHIADVLQWDRNKVRFRIREYLTILATHYYKIDRERGRSDTVYTKAAAKARFEPKDTRNPFVRE